VGQHVCNDIDRSGATCQALRDWAYDITLASAGLDWIALQHSAYLYMYSYLDANLPFTHSGRVPVRDVYGSFGIARGMTGGWSRRTMRTSVLLVTTQASGSPRSIHRMWYFINQPICPNIRRTRSPPPSTACVNCLFSRSVHVDHDALTARSTSRCQWLDTRPISCASPLSIA
jgi:hypothetical protein